MLIEALNKVDAASVKTEVKGSKHNRTSRSLHHYFDAHAPFKHYSTPRDRKEKKHQWRKLRLQKKQQELHRQPRKAPEKMLQR